MRTFANGLPSGACAPTVLAMLFFVVSSWGARAETSPDPNSGIREYYHYLIEAAQKDAASYRKIQEKLAEAGSALRSKGRLTAGEQSKLALYEEAYRLYGELADWHLSFRTLSAPGARRARFSEPLQAIPLLEEQLEALTKKPVVRTWVTEDEIAVLKSNGYKMFYDGKKGRYPFLRKHWMNKEEWQALQLKNAAEARARAEAAEAAKKGRQ